MQRKMELEMQETEEIRLGKGRQETRGTKVEKRMRKDGKDASLVNDSSALIC
jgi:hypothetical protein